MKLHILLAAIMLPIAGWAQEMKQLTISSTNIENPSVAISCTPAENPIIIYHSKITDLKFSDPFILDQRYIAEEQKYMLCVKAKRKYNIRIIHPDFAIQKHSIGKLEDRQVVEFILNAVTPTPLSSTYKVNVTAEPNNTIVYIDGVVRGKTPKDIEITPGRHFIKLKHSGYFTRGFYKNIKRNDVTYVDKRMYSKTFLNLNALYGFDAWGAEIGLTANNFSVAVNGLYRPDRYYYAKAEAVPLVDESNPHIAGREVRVAGDSLTIGWAVKAGFTFGWPVITRINVGYGRRGVAYRKSYTATGDFELTDPDGMLVRVKRNDMLKGTKQYIEQRDYYIIGAQVSLFRKFNVQADYWYSEEQKEWVLGFGLNLFGRGGRTG